MQIEIDPEMQEFTDDLRQHAEMAITMIEVIERITGNKLTRVQLARQCIMMGMFLSGRMGVLPDALIHNDH